MVEQHFPALGEGANLAPGDDVEIEDELVDSFASRPDFAKIKEPKPKAAASASPTE